MTTYIQIDGQLIDASTVTVPTRAFRDAWVLNGPVIEIDVSKAKEVWKTKLRQARATKMDKLDAEYFRALETGDTNKQTEVAATKQLLRDVTKHPDLLAASTVAEIEAFWPDYLT